VRHRTTARFWTCFARLPEALQRVARRNFALLKENRAHPSLHFKKVGKLWSVRAGPHHRALHIIGRWRSRTAGILSGFGSVPTMNTSESSSNKINLCIQPVPFSPCLAFHGWLPPRRLCRARVFVCDWLYLLDITSADDVDLVDAMDLTNSSSTSATD